MIVSGPTQCFEDFSLLFSRIWLGGGGRLVGQIRM